MSAERHIHAGPDDAGTRPYARRRPEATVLHRVVREHKATLFAEAEARSASDRGYPRHVREEFDKYERCGILAYGLIRARCQTCGDEQVVALSCKRRTLCGSCAGRRMTEITTHLVNDVLPVARYRQWTLSVPWRVRALLMVHPELVGQLQRLWVRILATHARRQARNLMAVRGTPLPRGTTLLTGAVVSIQRFGSRLTLHVHVHGVLPDAVWMRGANGALSVIDVPAPSDDDVARLVRTMCRKMTAMVERAPYRKRPRMEWARLLRQVFAVDILRCHCGGERKVIAALTRAQSPDALRRYLEHIPRQGLPRVVGEPVPPVRRLGHLRKRNSGSVHPQMSTPRLPQLPWDALIAD